MIKYAKKPRVCNEMFYTKTYAKNFDSGKTAGGRVGRRKDFAYGWTLYISLKYPGVF